MPSNKKFAVMWLCLLFFLIGNTNALILNIPNNIKPNVSISVRDMSNNNPVYDLNSNADRLIASNVKLFTSFFAVQNLKPDFKWQTKLYYSGTINNDILYGDLFLVGGGDPTLDNKAIYEIFSSLKSNYITKINGNIVLDDSIFNQIPQYSFLSTDPYDTDTILPSGLMINQEITRLTLAVKNTHVQVNSDLYGFKLINNLTVNFKDSQCNNLYNKIKITKTNNLINLSGGIPYGCNNKSLTYRFLSNFAYNRTIIYKVINDFNISFSGDVIAGKINNSHKLLYLYSSPSLAEVLIDMNRHSNNLIAETLVLSVGAYKTDNKQTYLDAIKKYNQFLIDSNWLTNQTTIENGAGLSRCEFFTTNDLVGLLSKIYYSPYQEDIMASLPVPSLDGALKNRFLQYKNNLYAKTGTLNDTVALSGYFINDYGIKYAFSIIFNDVDDYPIGTRDQIDVIIGDIFNQLNLLR